MIGQNAFTHVPSLVICPVRPVSLLQSMSLAVLAMLLYDSFLQAFNQHSQLGRFDRLRLPDVC